ncbi:choice-of-anchor I family protein [Flavimarina sp. Hel_I_48]|uniref:choice-of-anchor I family protein n=1 Tax=Flavimarina sp. Hel_I_48 TaxID=1392488 RepID=UPI000691C078|nr:choice-of-anchor I family protein [Flavimarina sp. Hel_I_48]
MRKNYMSLLFGFFSLLAIAQADPEINFDEAYISVNEDEGTATLTVSISESPLMIASVDVAILTEESTAMAGTDYEYDSQTLTFASSGDLTQSVTINITNNAEMAPDKLVALQLQNPVNSSVGEDNIAVIYILDDEAHTPSFTNSLGVTFGTSYAITGDNPGSEIVGHDPETSRLFVMNSGNASVEILDFSDPLDISALSTIDLSAYGEGGTSVAVHDGIVAATAVPDEVGVNGTVVFMDVDGTILSTIEAGALPDMITFTPDGSKLLVANEGEPSQDYLTDPEGSITVVDLSGGVENLTQNEVKMLNFNAFDAEIDALRVENIRIFDPNASVSQDLEPEYITVSADSQHAWVTLQENNAIAVVDLDAMEITDIFPMGLKDHSLPQNALDTSNEMDFAFMANWPIKGMYMPDAIANYTVGETTYYVTANEGDAREYDAFEEETNLEDMVLDAAVFPNQEFLQREENLGKLNFSSVDGDLDNDGEYEELHAYGGRSFSIYNGTTGEQVYDSADDFERFTLEDDVFGAIFNTTNDENEFKNRSDNKGPEPEALIVEEINGAFYAIVGLERIGGFMVYDVTNPMAPVFEGYFNNRSTEPGEDITGDLAPEGIIYVKPEDNATQKGLIVIANEVSATISVYTLENNNLSLEDAVTAKTDFTMYPNPAAGERIFFNKPTTFVLYDIQGRELQRKEDATYINSTSLSSGTYIVWNDKGESKKLLVK